MAVTPTARHAWTLFSLTVETRYGGGWQRRVSADTVVRLAAEIVRGFGGELEAGQPGVDDGAQTSLIPTVWRFPDGSRVHVGRFGVRMEDAANAAEARDPVPATPQEAVAASRVKIPTV